jgi:spore maturation protein CgeB
MTGHSPTIAFFGSSLVSAYWNGAATYYRGVIRALHARGFRVTFYEPDAFDRQAHRDIPDPPWAQVVVYAATEQGVDGAMSQAASADILIKASGVGAFDDLLEAALPARKQRNAIAVYWDVDAAATLSRLAADPTDPFRALIPQYDLVLTYGGGTPVVDAYVAFGARQCVPIYNALDPDVHHPVERNGRFRGHLGFLGNRLPDREARVDEFFFGAAARVPSRRFVLGGNGWADKTMTQNVTWCGHVYTADHNAFNCSPLAVLNVNRESMARMGFSPATRVFEAAGAGACIVTDPWDGLELFFAPETEILVARDGREVADIVSTLSPERARSIGAAARARAIREHTYEGRVRQLESLLSMRSAA